MISFIKKTLSGLSKTRTKLSNLFAQFSGKSILDVSDIEELEEALLGADIGWKLSESILEKMREPDKKEVSREERFQQCIQQYLSDVDQPRDLQKIILLVGINGTGKTTSAAKLGGYFSKAGESVSLVAADTYRAAAVEQIRVWAERLNLHLTANDKSADPASVAFDTIQHAVKMDADVVLIDTAGRLHNKVNLMKELSKVKRVMQKTVAEAPHEVLLVLDGSTGQNAFEQAKQFTAATEVTSLAVTKLDGTAKGGVVIGISDQFQIPVKYIGVGEGINDLQVFNKFEFVDSFFK